MVHLLSPAKTDNDFFDRILCERLTDTRLNDKLLNWESLPYVYADFEDGDRPILPVVPCVYLVVTLSDVIYVGQTTDTRRFCSHHRLDDFIELDAKAVHYIPTPKERLDYVETYARDSFSDLLNGMTLEKKRKQERELKEAREKKRKARLQKQLETEIFLSSCDEAVKMCDETLRKTFGEDSLNNIEEVIDYLNSLLAKFKMLRDLHNTARNLENQVFMFRNNIDSLDEIANVQSDTQQLKQETVKKKSLTERLKKYL